MAPWKVVGASQFVDRRAQIRQGRLQVLNVRAYRGVIVRYVAIGDRRAQPEYQKCPHAHQKPGAARKCAEAAARRLNKATR